MYLLSEPLNISETNHMDILETVCELSLSNVASELCRLAIASMCTTTCSVRKSPRKSSCLQPRSVELALKSLTQMKVFLWMLRCSHSTRLSSKSTEGAACVEQMKISHSLAVTDMKTQLSPVKRWVMTTLAFLMTTWSEFLFEVKIFQFFGKMDNIPFPLQWQSCNRPMSMSLYNMCLSALPFSVVLWFKFIYRNFNLPDGRGGWDSKVKGTSWYVLLRLVSKNLVKVLYGLLNE